MPRHFSTIDMIRKLSGLIGTKDLNEWEASFVTSLERRMNAGEVTMLTEKQIERLDELHSKHFA